MSMWLARKMTQSGARSVLYAPDCCPVVRIHPQSRRRMGRCWRSLSRFDRCSLHGFVGDAVKRYRWGGGFTMETELARFCTHCARIAEAKEHSCSHGLPCTGKRCTGQDYVRCHACDPNRTEQELRLV